MKPLTGSDNTFGTPREVFDYFNRWYGPFDLDAAANRKNRLVKQYLGQGGKYENALDPAVHWHQLGEKIWLNPPFGRGLGNWVKRAWEEHHRGCRIVMLLPASTGPRWYRDYVYGQEHYWLGRLQYVGGKTGAPWDSMIVILNPPPHFLKRFQRA